MSEKPKRSAVDIGTYVEAPNKAVLSEDSGHRSDDKRESDELDRLLVGDSLSARSTLSNGPSAGFDDVVDSRPTSSQYSVIAWMRWLLFVPVGVVLGVLTGLAVYFLVFRVASTLGGYGPDTTLNQWAMAAIAGWAVVEWGCTIAPTEKKAIPAGICGVATMAIVVAIISLGTPTNFSILSLSVHVSMMQWIIAGASSLFAAWTFRGRG